MNVVVCTVQRIEVTFVILYRYMKYVTLTLSFIHKPESKPVSRSHSIDTKTPYIPVQSRYTESKSERTA